MRRSLAVLVLVTSAFGCAMAWADAVPAGGDADIRARLKPFGGLCKAGDACGAPVAAATGTGLSATEIYGQYCTACHSTGAAGAPKEGDKAAWAPRIAQGMDALFASALNGKGGMPARGTCGNCSDDEIKATVKDVVAKSK